MNRPRALLPLGLVVGCFNPTESVDADTEGPTHSTGETEAPASSTSGTTGSSPTTDTLATTTDPTTDPSTTDPTIGETDSETTIGATCTDSSDCETGVCVEMECVPCSDAPDPDGACEDADSQLPFCSDSGTACVACTPESCFGDSPVCDPRSGCVSCTEHSDCPESACHLGGPLQGSCFDTNDVVEVSDATELANAMDAATSGTQTVVHLLAGTYSTGFSVEKGVEVALIGAPGTTLTGGATNLVYQLGGLLYVQGIEFDSGPFRAISVTGGGQLWLDDVSIENYTTALQVFDGSGTVRRCMFRGTTEAAIVDISEGSSLVAENTDFGPQGDPGLFVAGAVDLRYVTLAGNQSGLACANQATGTVRNSILVNPSATDAGGCSGNLDFVDNASDSPGFGQDVGPYDAGWFTISEGSRFYLSESGQEVFADLADWDEGDPLFDTEGDPRPTRERGYPGVDEP